MQELHDCYTMERFTLYLQKTQEGLSNLQEFNNFEVILGNESCDLDTAVCTLLLGFLIYENTAKGNLVLPVINVDRESFVLRTETIHLLKKCDVNLEYLIFRDEVDLSTIMENKSVRTHLVDHHVLSSKDSILEETVVQIIDHRPLDPSILPLLERIDSKIQEVGSCATLIADEILNNNAEILCEKSGLLLYATIICDTIALDPSKGKAKQLDIDVGEKLEEKFKFNQSREDLFEEVWSARCDVSHLTPKQLLYKDLKIVDGIPVPGLPILFEDYMKLDNAESYIKEFANEHNTSLVVFVTLDAKESVRRDIGIYYNGNTSVMDTFIQNLENCKTNKGYDLELSEVNTYVNNAKCFRQNNIKPSRKQIIPILRESILQYKI